MGKACTRFQTKLKRRKHPTRWGGTYLYGLYKRVPPPRIWEQLVQPINIKYAKCGVKLLLYLSSEFGMGNNPVWNLIGRITIFGRFLSRSSPELFVSFGSVVMENKKFSSRARYIKAEGLWGREFLKAWPSRFYSANNSFYYKLSKRRLPILYTDGVVHGRAKMCKDTRYMLPIPRKIEAPCSVESVESTEYATGL